MTSTIEHTVTTSRRTTVRTEGDRIVLRTTTVELAFSAQTGQWLTWRDLATDLQLTVGAVDQPDLILLSDGQEHRPPPRRIPYYTDATEASGPGRYIAHRLVDDGPRQTLVIEAQYGDWRVGTSYTVRSDSGLVEREWELTYSGVGETKLRHFSTFTRLAVENPAEWTLLLPGWDGQVAAQPLTTLVGQKPLTVIDAPFISIGLVGLRHEATARNAMLWPFSWVDAVDVTIALDGAVLEVRHDVKASARLSASDSLRHRGGRALQVGGDWDLALAALQDSYIDLGLRTPADRPDWTARAAIYEVHIGTAVFRDDYSYAPFTEINDLLADLPRIAALGFEVIQIMPKQPYPCYAVHDYYDITTSYGDEGQLRRLVAAAHGMGLRVILDVLMHGVMDQEVIDQVEHSARTVDDQHWPELRQTVIDFAPYWRAGSYPRHPLAAEHPDWFMRTEDGEIAAIYTKAFDLANPAVQEYFGAAMEFLVRELDVDGFRFDAPNWNVFPDWNPNRQQRASYSTFGSVEMFRKVRRQLRALKPDILFYTESSGPLFREAMDLNYNYDEHWLIPAVMRGKISARQMGEWFDARRKALPRGFVTAHHVDSHDSFWWELPGNKWRREQYGQAAASALVAVLALIDGAFMNYVGGEAGQEEFLTRLLHLRHTMPQLRDGACSYSAVGSANKMVFTALRDKDGERAIVAVNLSDQELQTELSVPSTGDADQLASPTVFDALAEETIPADQVHHEGANYSISLRFAPYQARLLVL